jgi:hypothetical protein
MKIPNVLPLYADHAGAQAVVRLLALCFRHQSGGTRPIAEFLVSLYNANYARPDMYLLCRQIDDDHFDDVLLVMGWFRDLQGRSDIHVIFGNAGDVLMRELMDRFGLGCSASVRT